LERKLDSDRILKRMQKRLRFIFKKDKTNFQSLMANFLLISHFSSLSSHFQLSFSHIIIFFIISSYLYREEELRLLRGEQKSKIGNENNLNHPSSSLSSTNKSIKLANEDNHPFRVHKKREDHKKRRYDYEEEEDDLTTSTTTSSNGSILTSSSEETEEDQENENDDFSSRDSDMSQVRDKKEKLKRK